MTEILGFLILALFVVRILFLVYFIVQAVKYSRLKTAQHKDGFTFATLILIIIASLMFLSGGLAIVALNKIKTLDEAWYLKYRSTITILSDVLNQAFGFVGINIAYMCNIYRWKILIHHLSETDPQKMLKKEIWYKQTIWAWVAYFILQGVAFAVLKVINWKYYQMTFFIV